MRHDHHWHITQARRRKTKRAGGIALFAITAAIGGLVAERVLPITPPVPEVRSLSTTNSVATPPVSGVRFGLCHSGGGANCVVDGDTFWIAGTKIRIADIDAPETHPSRCAEEADLGERATLRLRDLLNAGPVTLASADRDTDRYGRKLRIVTRDGRSLGDTLIAEGLARRWGGRRMPWCT